MTAVRQQPPAPRLVIVVAAQACTLCGRWLNVGTEAARLPPDGLLAHVACAYDQLAGPGGR
jgi:hypothetical protein